MARVDPDDDTIARFVAHHYRYDPTRHERRNVLLAAFDDEAEFEEFVRIRHAELRTRQRAGQAEHDERIGGTVHEPGHRERASNNRLLSRALAHGVWPAGWDPKNPPDGVQVVSVETRENSPGDP